VRPTSHEPHFLSERESSTSERLTRDKGLPLQRKKLEPNGNKQI
jgi:hypothetical protein